LLSEAVKRLRSDRGFPLDKNDLVMKAFKPLVLVDLPLHTNIPPDYVPDRTMRLSLYRRIADAETIEDIDKLIDEFIDRFGQPPSEVENLFFQMKIKLLAKDAGFNSVNIEKERIILRFPEGKPPLYLSLIKHKIRIGKTAGWIDIPDDIQDWKPFLFDLLTEICTLQPE
jgi:transcription-repair coupling factor (superfamily II helicase)